MSEEKVRCMKMCVFRDASKYCARYQIRILVQYQYRYKNNQMKKLVTKYSYINRERGILCSGLGRFLVTLYTAYLVFFSYLYFNIFRYPNILLSLKEKYLGTSRATLIFVHPTKLSNHNLSCGKYFLLFFLISYFFLYT